MKKLLGASVFTLFIFSSCMKNDAKCHYTDSTIIASNAEKQNLSDSLDKYGITNTTMDTSGFYYTIENPGTGRSVSNLCSNILVTYEGGFFNGKLFDSSRIDTTVTPHQKIPSAFQLGSVITGWQKAIPLLRAGGEINIYIPPSLAYGAADYPRQGPVIIPGNSYLVFKVQVLDIQ